MLRTRRRITGGFAGVWTRLASPARTQILPILRRPSLPLWLLALLVLVAAGARLAWLGEPCRSPCQSANDHTLVFDEAYYVNAARVIVGITPPAGVPYANAPLGVDANSEHPPLAKLVIAGGIELFGDGPFAWRVGSVVMATAAILGMFTLALAVGGSRWLGLGAAALMAADNLLLVHGRIGTLDIYAVAAMIWGAALYLRGRPWLAGLVIGIGACAKEVAPYVLFALGALEALRWVSASRARPARARHAAGDDRTDAAVRLRRLAACVLASAGSFLALLTVFGLMAPPYSPQTGKRVPDGPFGEIGHILSYAAHQTSPHGPRGIASYPWDWLVDYKSITYLRVNPARPADGLYYVHPPVHFLGLISPPILLLALPSLLFAAVGVFRRRAVGGTEVGLVGLAWFLGTFLPFVALSLFENRTTYIYYMVIVMPGIYLSVADLVARVGPKRIVSIAWMVSVLAAAVVLYPFSPLT